MAIKMATTNIDVDKMGQPERRTILWVGSCDVSRIN